MAKLTFTDDYFKAEERCGFFVSETMKRYWACCMEIVNIIDGVCDKYGINYFADWGTMLGAVRHNGFIPWDDDMDIALIRPDYDRLMKVLPGELPPGYKLSTPYSNPEHRQFFSGVSNGIEMNLSKEHLAEFYNCPFVATIDIFPLDYIPDNKGEAKVLKSVFIIIWNAVQKVKDENASKKEVEEAVREVEQCLDIKIERNEYMRSQLWRLANDLVKSYTEADGSTLVPWCAYVNSNVKFNKHWFDNIIRVPFEEHDMPVPSEYDKVLTQMYGDWRTPVRGTQLHNYPCFNRQLDFLRRKVKELQEEEKIKKNS